MAIHSTLLATIIGVACLLNSTMSIAVPVTVDASGTVTEVFSADTFGTLVGDPIIMRATFDTSALVNIPSLSGTAFPGLQFASLSTGLFASLSINMPGKHWTAADDPDFGLGSVPRPYLILQNGDFIGLNFFGIGDIHDVFLNDARDSLLGFVPPGTIFGGDDDPNGELFWIGVWDLEHATVSVPEPASLALLGLGLAGIGFSARKKARKKD